MDALILIALDLVAITLLAGVLYCRRHRRRRALGPEARFRLRLPLAAAEHPAP